MDNNLENKENQESYKKQYKKGIVLSIILFIGFLLLIVGPKVFKGNYGKFVNCISYCGNNNKCMKFEEHVFIRGCLEWSSTSCEKLCREEYKNIKK